tara:strand:- start:32884 stop:33093 length:210 start_codon:yes stop_codon:yes gene_type:complete
LKIQWQDLSEDALDGVIEDFVTREGTEYGPQEVSLAAKVQMVKKQLQKGIVSINFDPETESCTIQLVEG